MTSTAVIIRMDDLGRVVIPKMIREKMGIKNPSDEPPIEFDTADNGDIVIRLHKESEETE